MANEYRDALQAAQRRITSLEQELELARAGIVRPPRSSHTWLLGVPVLLVGAWLGGLLCVDKWANESATSRAPEPFLVPAPTVLPVSYGVTFYTGGGSRPSLVDVDGDGRKEIVSLFWGKAEDRPLQVGVLDRDTLAVRWMRGPFPSQWSGVHTHLAIVGRHAVVTDSRETLHVVDLGSGVEVRTVPFPGGAREACGLPGSSTEVALELAWDKWKVLDVVTGDVRDVKKTERPSCARSSYRDCEAKTDPIERCTDYDRSAATRAKTPGFTTYGATEVLGDVRFVTGTAKTPKGATSGSAAGPAAPKAPAGPETRETLLMLDRKTKAHRWEAPAIAQGDTLHLGGRTSHTLTRTNLVTFYQTDVGEFRLLARDVLTGQESWRTKVSGAKEGSYAGELFVEDGDVFVFVDHALHVIALETGVERKVLTWL